MRINAPKHSSLQNQQSKIQHTADPYRQTLAKAELNASSHQKQYSGLCSAMNSLGKIMLSLAVYVKAMPQRHVRKGSSADKTKHTNMTVHAYYRNEILPI